MTFSHPETSRSVAQILATDVLPMLYRAQKLPLRISCLGIANYGDDDDDSFDRVIPLGEAPSPEEAMRFASLRAKRGDICSGPDSYPYFVPRIMLIQDHEHRLVLAGEIRAGIILWQQPAASDIEARRIVTQASRLRGAAFWEADRTKARAQCYRAAVMEARLVDPFWRETATELLRLPKAA